MQSGVLEQLRRERDTAIKDGAVQQGRVEALETQVERLQTETSRLGAVLADSA